MNVSIFIECNNAAFDGNPALEVARMLRKLADQMNSEDDLVGLNGKSLLDVNGLSSGFIDFNAEG